MSPVLVRKFNATLNRCYGTRLINAYGPTEATVDVTNFDCSTGAGDFNLVPIGRPIKNTRVYILDNNRLIQPMGVPGELCVAGDSLARGYLNNPETTSEKFQWWSGQRLYHTGDLARWLPDGNIEFLGRIDRQVKIRGFRIELGEIESRLLKHDEVKEAVVIDRQREGIKYLCAYFVPARTPSIPVSELRGYLLDRIPAYMVPAHFMVLDKLPLTTNLKINTDALPEPDSPLSSADYHPPRTEFEETVARVWCEVLQLENKGIGIHDNFFDIGGDSLRAIQASSRLKKAGIPIDVANIFSYQTIESINTHMGPAARANTPPPVMKKAGAAALPFQPGLINLKAGVTEEDQLELIRVLKLNRRLTVLLTKNKVTRQYQLSPVQRSSLMLTSHELMAKHNLLTSCHFESPVPADDSASIDIVEELVTILVSENALLRSVIVKVNRNLGPKEDGNYMIREFQPFANIPVPYMDISGFSPGAKEQFLHIIHQRISSSLELMEHLLYRVLVLKWDYGKFRVIFSVNHLIFDGESVRILPEKMADINRRYLQRATAQSVAGGYAAPPDDSPPPQGPGKIDYYDYCNFIKRLDYSHIRLDKFLDLDDYKHSVETVTHSFKTNGVKQAGFEIDLANIDERLKSFYNEILLLTYAKSLNHFFGIDPVPISLVFHGRHYQDGHFGDVIGDFHDFIPFYFPVGEHADCNRTLERLLEFKKYIKEMDLNFTAYLVRQETTRDDIVHLVSPFSFNSLIGLYETVKQEQRSESIDSQDEALTDENRLRRKCFDMEMVRDPESERIWISFTQNSNFDLEAFKERFLEDFHQLVEEELR
ncbi:MAG: AMP-binding protein [bacterium]|nr:AMP-binding protein [bacterium]